MTTLNIKMHFYYRLILLFFFVADVFNGIDVDVKTWTRVWKQIVTPLFIMQQAV